MTNGQFLLSTLAVVGAIIIALAEGRRTVAIASLAAAIALAPAALVVGGSVAALLPVAGAVTASLTLLIARSSAERLPWVPGLDPEVPVIGPSVGLFGPRSVRMTALLVGLPAMSWISLNVQLVGGTDARGVVFASGYIWIAAVARMLLARTVEDLAAGFAVVAIASGVAWTAQGGTSTYLEDAAVIGLAPVAAGVAGWLTGRHHRGTVRAVAVKPSP